MNADFNLIRPIERKVIQMTNYGKTYSTVRPQDVEINEIKVFVASDISEIEVATEEGAHTEYEYNLVEYDKDEYIETLQEEIKQLS